MPDMTLAIPDDVVAALRLPPDEIESTLRKELALAQMARWDFEELLCQRHIERPFSEEDLAEDLQFAREFSKGQ